jgi:hypothetical protein
MTKAEREIIYKACELVERTGWYSCLALAEVGGGLHLTRYAWFFDRSELAFWYNCDERERFFTLPTKEQRILMLLLFLEAEGDVL